MQKNRKVSITYSTELNWVGYPIEENTEGEIHECFDVSGDILKFSFQTWELMQGITG